MSQFPPCSGRPGIVLAPSLPIFSFKSPVAEPACTFFALGGSATVRLRWVCVEMSSPSRLFHNSRTSAEGAQPRIPGWMRPAKRTPGMWREEQKMPSKSQMAFALGSALARYPTVHEMTGPRRLTAWDRSHPGTLLRSLLRRCR
jgi:hypothetical protein